MPISSQGLEFQSTLPHAKYPKGGERLRSFKRLPQNPPRFNPRSRTRSTRRVGSDGLEAGDYHPDLRFNPRSRTGSDPHRESGKSTHTVSIHAPARGATRLLRLSNCCSAKFQSTLPHGERLDRVHQGDWLIPVSIHAPARGATSGDHSFPRRSSFNPRSRTGSDQPRAGGAMEAGRFNPRSRTGSDSNMKTMKSYKVKVSIHAPARGATRLLRLSSCSGSVSIHAPARGATT